MEKPYIFGIRHLSPAGAFYLRKFLDAKKPSLVLVEGPDDLNDQMENLVKNETKPPVAILAYTRQVPVRTIFYPLAEYSPEYQAFLWCSENNVPCRFFDLPSSVFLSFPGIQVHNNSGNTGGTPGEGTEKDSEGKKEYTDVYTLIDKETDGDGHETFWERTMEQAADEEGYFLGAGVFGKEIRRFEEENGQAYDMPETVIRESYMKRHIAGAISEGYAPDKIVVVTGAYHTAGLLSEGFPPMSEDELESLPETETDHTLMPYSYYRLSSRSGYGAGNKAPAYYGLLWKGFLKGEPMYAAYSYMSKIAGYQRKHGNPVSPAEVIDAVRLACALANLKGGTVPALRDLRDAAVTCIGRGSFSAISLAVADTEIGTAVGSLPEGVSRTSIQDDFYRQLKENKLEKYRQLAMQELTLDLRENRRVASGKSAFLDLHRSFFLHQLRVLGISFAKQEQINQENATWSEHWLVRWTPEAEMELVEAALEGDTVIQAASFHMKEQIENADNIGRIAEVIEDGFTCGMASTVQYAVSALQAMATDEVSIDGLASTVHHLSTVISYGDIRHLDAAPLEPVLKQMFYRACLVLPGSCTCDDATCNKIVKSIEYLNTAGLAHDFLDNSAWLRALSEAALRDDLNTKLSGFAMAVLLERGSADETVLRTEVQRRLSPGVPAELGAAWFEGLAMKNRYALVARLSLWKDLGNYIEGLDDEGFKRALVFLRRAFADFTSAEKDAIAENLGEIWGLNGQQVSEAVNQFLNEEENSLVAELDDFDFDL